MDLDYGKWVAVIGLGILLAALMFELIRGWSDRRRRPPPDSSAGQVWGHSGGTDSVLLVLGVIFLVFMMRIVGC